MKLSAYRKATSGPMFEMGLAQVEGIINNIQSEGSPEQKAALDFAFSHVDTPDYNPQGEENKKMRDLFHAAIAYDENGYISTAHSERLLDINHYLEKCVASFLAYLIVNEGQIPFQVSDLLSAVKADAQFPAASTKTGTSVSIQGQKYVISRLIQTEAIKRGALTLKPWKVIKHPETVFNSLSGRLESHYSPAAAGAGGESARSPSTEEDPSFFEFAKALNKILVDLPASPAPPTLLAQCASLFWRAPVPQPETARAALHKEIASLLATGKTPSGLELPPRIDKEQIITLVNLLEAYRSALVSHQATPANQEEYKRLNAVLSRFNIPTDVKLPPELVNSEINPPVQLDGPSR